MKITRRQLRRLIKEEVHDLLQRKMDRDNTSSGGTVSVSRVGTSVVDFLDDEIYADHKTKISAAASGDPKIKAVRAYLFDLADDLHEEEILWRSEDPKIAHELKRLGNFLDDIIDDYDGKDSGTQGAWAEKGLSADYLFLVGQFVDSPRESLRQELWKVEHELGR